MKRPSEEIGVELEVKSDASSEFEFGKSGEKLRLKKVRVSERRALEGVNEDQLPMVEELGIQEGSWVFDPTEELVNGSEEVGMGIEGKENEGIENQVMGVENFGFVAEVGMRIEGKENKRDENRIMGVEELGIVAEEDRILSGKEVCGSRDRDKEEVGVKESKKVGCLKEVRIGVKETERMDNRMEGFGIEEDTVLKGVDGCGKGDREEEENKKNDYVRELEKVGPISGCGSSTRINQSIMTVDDAKGEEEWDLDLNVPVLEAEGSGSEVGFQEYIQVGPVIAERRTEIIDISSDESEDEGEKLVDGRDGRGKNKEIDKGFDSIGVFNLDLGITVPGQAADGSSSLSGGRRYTREEKGKAKLVDSWLTLAFNPVHLDLKPEGQQQIETAISGGVQINETSQPEETNRNQRTGNLVFRTAQAMLSERTSQALRQRADPVRRREISSCRARQLAHFNPQLEDYHQKSFIQEQKMPSIEADKELEDLQGPFSTALKILRERNSKRSVQQLIEWKPLECHRHNTLVPLVPSLLDLCLKVLAKNPEAIFSLEPVPDALKHRLTDLLCDLRRMNMHVLDLLVSGSPTEIRIKDCSWITEEQFTKTFGSLDSKNLTVLQLDLCGQCVLDDVLAKTLTQSSNSLPGLGIISLRGACRLSDIALKALVASAPALQSINLGQCSLLTPAGVDILANSLGSILRELYIDDCQRINAMLIVPALKKFEHLEVLSVAGIHTVCDEFVNNIITARGRSIKELDLADCQKLTDVSLKVIGNTCSDLCSLSISNLLKLTDLGIQYLANGCRSIQTLKICRNRFSDDAIAAFLEASGESLKELSLNNVSKVGPNTALSLAKCSRKLLSLDLSWCRRITNEALGLIVDSCLSLKLLKLFGCTQITTAFLNGHSNSLVRIIGLNLTPVLEHLNMLEPEEVLLRYSPLTFYSQNVGNQDVPCI